MTVLIIGLGSIGKKHVVALKLIDPECCIYALRYKKDCDDFLGVINVFSLQDIRESPDFVIIANNTNAHAETIKKVLCLRCPIFIEKPVMSDIQYADEISKAIMEFGVLTYVACNLRFHPSLKFIKSFLQGKKIKINEVNCYSGSYLPNWRPDRDFRLTYSANSELGGGVHLDLIHEIDYCTWLFGFPDTVTSFCYKNSSLRIDAIDGAYYHLDYSDFACNVSLNYFRKDTKRTLEIVFEDRTLLVDIVKNIVTDNSTGLILYSEPDYAISETYIEQLRYFIGNITSGKAFLNDFDYAVKVLKISVNE